MGRVTGIGGFFFRAREPAALNAWYAEHFGVVLVGSDDDQGWFQERGETVFSAFKEDSDFAPRDKRWKINFRVDDLDAVVAGLQRAGVSVERHPRPYSYGTFAELEDPEGNPIQLWQPSAQSLARDAHAQAPPG